MIRLKNLSLTYKNGVKALDNISLHVRPGEFVSLVGPSGCGKSTLLKMVAGLLPVQTGQIECERDSISFVFQSPTLLPWRTTLDNVHLPFELGRKATCESIQTKALSRDALQHVGLSEFESTLPSELSGGMKMRAAIARALVTQPKILLMDEPFSALDEITKQNLATDLIKICESQKPTVLFVTHNLYEAVYLSHRVLVMSPRPGRIIEEFQIPFQAPRTPAVRYSAEFSSLCATIQKSLMDGIQKGAA